MGHRSDAVDNYQITSDEQRQAMSAIIANPKSNTQGSGSSVLEVKVGSGKNLSEMSCVCTRQNVNTTEIGDMSGVINQILNACKGQKVTVKIEVSYEPQ